jgi:hypothetical protein
LIFLLCPLAACAGNAMNRAARVYQDGGFVKPGSYRLAFRLDGQGTLADYLFREKSRSPHLDDFGVAELTRLFRTAYPQLYEPVQPGVPLCNLETSFRYCKGIELLADLDIFTDQTVVLHSWVFYHITLRIEAEHPNFFRSAKAQRDRGEFALPRHFYVGELVDTIQRGLPILREIATDYRKYLKNDDREVEIELTLEVFPERAAARIAKKQIRDGADLGSGVLFSALPNLPFFAGLTVSALYSGGKTFWEVLEEGKEFAICKRDLTLEEVEFSYPDSFARNFSHLLKSSSETPSAVILREIRIRLRQKEESPDDREVVSSPLPSPG